MKDKAEEILELLKLSFIDYESIGFIGNESIEFNLRIEYNIHFTGDVDSNYDLNSNTLNRLVFDMGFGLNDVERKKIKKYREVIVFRLHFLSKNSYKNPMLREKVKKMFDEYILEAVKKFNINSWDFKINDFKYDELNFYRDKISDNSVKKSNWFNLYTDTIIKIYSEEKDIIDYEYIDYGLPF